MKPLRTASCIIVVLVAALFFPGAQASAQEQEAEGYGVAHIVVRENADWAAIAEAVCQFAPRVVVVSGAALPPEPLCGATMITTRAQSGDATMVDADAFYVLREDPSGEAEGALHRARRTHRGARSFVALAERYVPMASPREELILQSDDPVDAILAADSPIADPAAGAVRPFGGARVFASGLPDASSFRAYWIDASGVTALGPASPVNAPPGPSPSDSPSE